jgi:cell division protein FtsW
MKQLVNNLKGDKVIWSFVALLALFMPVFSASSNGLFRAWNRKYFGVKHLVHICIGFLIIYA